MRIFEIAKKRVCKTPGAEYKTTINSRSVKVDVKLPPEVKIGNLSKKQGAEYDDMIHDSMEKIVARIVADTMSNASSAWAAAKKNDKSNLSESLSTPIICVDVQPEYSGIHDGDENSIFQNIISFVNKQTGPVLMYVNAEDQGLTGDTIQDIQIYWEDSGFDPNNWSRITIVDKGYGYLRGWMDTNEITDSTIIKIIRLMYQQQVNDSEELSSQGLSDEEFSILQHNNAEHGPISINWINVAQLKKFNGAYIIGGGRNECLREVELIMNAFNIKYKRIDQLVY